MEIDELKRELDALWKRVKCLEVQYRHVVDENESMKSMIFDLVKRLQEAEGRVFPEELLA